MDEAAAHQWLDLNVSRETRAIIDRFVALLVEANVSQNLIARGSLPQVYARHIVDSAQLAGFVRVGRCVDLGSGAGLPGILIGIMTGLPILLIEERRLRSEFLQRVINTLGLTNVTVEARAVARVEEQADVITARAFAPLDRLFRAAAHLAHPGTLWVLPKGRRAKEELASLDGKWHARVSMEPSLTDPDSTIIVARDVRRIASARQ